MKLIATLLLLLLIPPSDRVISHQVFKDLALFEKHTQAIDERYLQDVELQKLFPITDTFYANTRFWFMIYTYFDDSKLVIHDRNNLQLIYHVQDFSQLDKNDVHPFAQSYIQEELIKNQIKTLKEKLLLLSQSTLPERPDLLALYNQVVRSGLKIGQSPQEHKETFKKLAKGLRAQRGLKNHIEEGLIRYNLYADFLTNYFNHAKLPQELIAISFLESSFNPHAHSKSKAAGVWQLMPFLHNNFFPSHSPIDYRLNIGLSSIAAAALLKENFQILKRWDLAITAYNSGVKHILAERRRNPALTLEELIRNSEHTRFGFASKNFYAEFLALTRVLKFREELFPSTQAVNSLKDLHFYFAKCNINLNQIFSKTEQQYLRSLNHQLRKMTVLKKGTLLSTDQKLKSTHFELVGSRDLFRKRPKNWMNAKKNYSCSTK